MVITPSTIKGGFPPAGPVEVPSEVLLAGPAGGPAQVRTSRWQVRTARWQFHAFLDLPNFNFGSSSHQSVCSRSSWIWFSTGRIRECGRGRVWKMRHRAYCIIKWISDKTNELLTNELFYTGCLRVMFTILKINNFKTNSNFCVGFSPIGSRWDDTFGYHWFVSMSSGVFSAIF